MQSTRNRINLQHVDENELLACVVEAMLDAQHDLQDASQDQWSRILVDSCRRRKVGAVSELMADVVCC
jgi:hypothetical protein